MRAVRRSSARAPALLRPRRRPARLRNQSDFREGPAARAAGFLILLRCEREEKATTHCPAIPAVEWACAHCGLIEPPKRPSNSGSLRTHVERRRIQRRAVRASLFTNVLAIVPVVLP